MDKIYKSKTSEKDNRFYRMIKPVGSWDREGCRHYALWQPCKRFCIFWCTFYFAYDQEFWIEPEPFTLVEN